MSNVEKEYQKRFSGKQEYNSDFDTEGLWGAISATTQPKKKNRKILFIWLIFGTIVLGVLSLLWRDDQAYNTTKQQATLVQEDKESANQTIQSDELDQTIETDSNLIQPNDSVIHTSIQSIAYTDVKNIAGSEYRNRTNNLNTSASHSQNTIIDNESKLNVASLKEQSIKTLSDNNTESITAINQSPHVENGELAMPSINAIVTTNSTENQTQETSNHILIFPSIDPIELSLFAHERNKVESNLTRLPIIEDSYLSKINEENDSTHKKSFTLDIYGGINFSHNTYSSDSIATLQNAAEKTFAGQTYGISLSKSLYNNVTGSVGVEYNDLWTKLDINESRKTTQLLMNALVRVIVDSQTLDTIKIYQDTVVNAQYTKKLVHHNNVKTLSIPLSIGYHHDFNTFELGVNVGIVYNLLLSQSGKRYNEQGDIVSYDNHSPNKPFEKSNYALRFSPVMRYKFNPDLSLTFFPQYQFSNGSPYAHTDNQVKSSIWNFNIGIGKRF